MTQERTPTEVADLAAAALVGTAQYLHSVLVDLDAEDMDADQEFCDRLDELVFECEECRWWYDASEMAGDQVCGDCAEDDNE